MKPQVNINVNITVDNLKQFESAINLLKKKQVLAGVPSANTPRPQKNKSSALRKIIRFLKGQKYITNSSLAYIHDKGSPSRNIPPRPFMEPGIKTVKNEIRQHLLAAGQATMEGDLVKTEQELHAVGLTAQNGIRNKINSNIQPPLKKETLAARRRRGRTGTRTLIDTGQLRNSITYVVKDK